MMRGSGINDSWVICNPIMTSKKPFNNSPVVLILQALLLYLYQQYYSEYK